MVSCVSVSVCVSVSGLGKVSPLLKNLIYTGSVWKACTLNPAPCLVSSKRLQTTRLVLRPTFCHRRPAQGWEHEEGLCSGRVERKQAPHSQNMPPSLRSWWRLGGELHPPDAWGFSESELERPYLPAWVIADRVGILGLFPLRPG